MAKNKVHDGHVLTLVAPGTKLSGAGVLVGAQFGVSLNDVLVNDPMPVAIDGVWTLPKLSTDVVAQGVYLYWDDANSRLTVTASTNKLVGKAEVAAGNGVANVQISLIDV